MPHIRPHALPSLRRAALAAALCLLAAASARQPLDGVVAVVDDQVVLLSELEELRMVSAGQPGLQRESPDQQRKELLEKLIDDKVVLVKAKQDTSIKISERDIAPRVEEAISRYVDQQGGEKRFETLLKQTNGMNLAQFRARLSQQFLDQSYRQRLQVKYVGDHDPSNQQVREFYERYKDSLPLQQNGLRLSHIQIKINPSPALPLKGRGLRAWRAAAINLDVSTLLRVACVRFDIGPNVTWVPHLRCRFGTSSASTLTDYFANAAFTIADTAVISARPASLGFNTPITLPMSCGPTAPVAATAALTSL